MKNLAPLKAQVRFPHDPRELENENTWNYFLGIVCQFYVW